MLEPGPPTSTFCGQLVPGERLVARPGWWLRGGGLHTRGCAVQGALHARLSSGPGLLLGSEIHSGELSLVPRGWGGSVEPAPLPFTLSFRQEPGKAGSVQLLGSLAGEREFKDRLGNTVGLPLRKEEQQQPA